MEVIIAINPSHRVEPEIAIAACRAGETGILDLGWRDDEAKIRDALGSLRRFAGTRGRWGIRWDTLGEKQRSPKWLSRFINEPVSTLILSGADPNNYATVLQEGRRFAQRIFLEILSFKEALMAQDAGYDGVILKGHESGGFVSNESSFILLQRFHNKLDIPYWIQGGMGLHTSAAAYLSGSEGIVLCEQLWLTEESPFSTEEKNTWKRFDGSETICFGNSEFNFRCFSRSGPAKIRKFELTLAKNPEWKRTLNQWILDPENDSIIPCGQDIGLASSLAREFGTVGGILSAIRSNISKHLESARESHPFTKNSSLSKVHGTQYPIVQGPMARVSDVVSFGEAVAKAGGLPFFGLSLMRGSEIRELLNETLTTMNSMTWGVGVIGFAPKMLYDEQLSVIREFVPPFAIIAGGRPGQAAEFEAFGTSTYLHVPSPQLLNTFLKEGSRKFIFEGRECGGHVGPITSFILWETVIEHLLKSKIAAPGSIQILFAGGIHDSLSAAMVEILAAPLASIGMKIGVLMGTAYLFTNEAVEHGAITSEYQNQVMKCEATVLLQSGIGHESRCVQTPFVEQFYAKKQELVLNGKTGPEVLKSLESMNLGRLRLAAKGISRRPGASSSDNHDQCIVLDKETQRCEGLYMIGQVAELRHTTLSIADLHADVCEKSRKHIENMEASDPYRSDKTIRKEGIAIVGMACLFPEASDLRKYWQNILNRICTIREVPRDRWDTQRFFEPDRLASDKSYSKWGGFLKDILFDPLKYRIPPRTLENIEPMQLLALEISWQALEDAGYHQRFFPRERTSVIFGACGGNDLGIDYCFRSMFESNLQKVDRLPQNTHQHIVDSMCSRLPPMNEDSFPGMLVNIVAGRIANRLDLGGTNFTVEAACASSFAAVEVAIHQLQTHTCDVALTGAVDVSNNLFTYILFSRTQALSPRGESRPMDDSADGIVLGEGVASLVLKRLSDAERDGDRIYAVIKGIGSSSDGRNRSLIAPHPEGQIRALRRAYRNANINPNTVECIELHGTGTVVGDKAEIESLSKVYKSNDGGKQHCAIGSVKSMIGHTKVAAGMAGLIKTAMALKHKILPPTIGIEVPNSKTDFACTPFYVNTESRPWFAGTRTEPRRAAVSAFGFGGTNFHLVLEEYDDEYRDQMKLNLSPREAEIFSFTGINRSDIEEKIKALLQHLENLEQLNLSQLAYSVFIDEQDRPIDPDKVECRLNIVASSIEDLKSKLGFALKDTLTQGFTKNSIGLYYSEMDSQVGSVCFLFPGQGSQRVNMLRDIVIAMPETYALFEKADKILDGCYNQPLSRYIYPTPVFSEAERRHQQEELNKSHVAQPAMGLINLTAFNILKTYNIQPEMLAGHSFGEYAALCAAESISQEDFIRLSEIRGKIVQEAHKNNPGAMVAVQAGMEEIATVLRECKLNTSVANYNAPDQTVIGGSLEEIKDAINAFKTRKLPARRIPVKAAFHTPTMGEVSDTLSTELINFNFQSTKGKVFSNTTAHPYPQTPEEIRKLLVRHICEPVKFDEEIREIYDRGARVFIEVGPGRVLTSFVEKILKGEPYHSLSFDAVGQPGWLQLAHLLAHAKTIGLPVDLNPWFEWRHLEKTGTKEVFETARAISNPDPLTWRVNGGRAIPYYDSRKETRPPNPGQWGKRAHPYKSEEQSVKQPEIIAQQRTQTVEKDAAPQKETSPVNTDKHHIRDNSINSTPLLDHLQNAMTQFLGLQQEHQKTMQKFIEMQEQMLRTAIHAELIEKSNDKPAHLPHDPDKEEPAHSKIKQPVFVTAGVPPTPIIPKISLRSSQPTPADSPPEASISDAPSTALPVKEVPDVPASGRPQRIIPTVEEFEEHLLRIISERTGFPIELLDLNQNLETELGLDSIKKIEVFWLLREQFDLMKHLDEESLIEELAGFTTLNGVLEWYGTKRHEFTNVAASHTAPIAASPDAPPDAAISSLSASSNLEAKPKAPAIDGEPEAVDRDDLLIDPVKRWVLRPAPIKMNHTPERMLPPSLHTVLLLGQITGLSSLLEQEFSAHGQAVHYLIPGKETKAKGNNCYEVDFSSLQSVQNFRHLINQSGRRVGAVFNLMGLTKSLSEHKTFNPLVRDLTEVEKTTEVIVAGNVSRDENIEDAKRLFLLLKVFEQDLKKSARESGAWLVNFSSIDGHFGLKRKNSFPVGQAGCIGTAKAVAKEWSQIFVKCIDIDPDADPTDLMTSIRYEIATLNDLTEVGLDGKHRWKIDLVEDHRESMRNASFTLDSDSVILVTGGGYGIVSEITRELAARYRPRIIIVGRSPYPQEEPDTIKDLQNSQELRQFLINEMKRDDPSISLAAIDRQLHRIIKARQIQNNLEFMKARGAKVEYYSLDIRNAKDFGGLIDNIYEKWGQITGVIHGAGIIEDKLIGDKTTEIFSRVFDTKVMPAMVLAKKIRPEGLKFLTFFSSTSARFGNIGQTDYSAGNEVLNKLANRLNSQWKARIVSINWGPWDSGMITDGLRKLYSDRGIKLIPVTEGVKMFFDELCQSPDEASEVVITRSLPQIQNTMLKHGSDV